MTRARNATTRRIAVPESFAELNAALPLRPIRDRADYDNAVEMIDRLAVLSRRTVDQEDYVETLTELVGKYDDEHFAADLSRRSPVQTLRLLCEQNQLSASALGELLGNRSLGSKILREERQLSKEHIRKLSDHFAVSTDLFLK